MHRSPQTHPLEKQLIGWKEWCTLPNLHIPLIKAKIDTGAKTSALHAFDIEPFVKNGIDWVRFAIHPIQYLDTLSFTVEAPIFDKRNVMSSNGHMENRYVILTPLHLGEEQWEIELTLSNRDPLRFRLLLGREALQHRVLIDPCHQYVLGNHSKTSIRKHYHAHPKHPKHSSHSSHASPLS